MVKKYLVLVALIALVLCAIPVNAETVSGTLGSAGTSSSNYFWNHAMTGGSACDFKQIRAVNIENLQEVEALIHFDNASYKTAYSNATFYFGSAPFSATIGGVYVGNGTIGFQRLWSGSTEQAGYQYLVFSDWSPGSFTGSQTITLTWNMTDLGLLVSDTILQYDEGSGSPYPTTPSTYLTFWNGGGSNPVTGSNTLNLDTTFLNTYTAEKPIGIGIMGTVTKGSYPSKIHIVDGDSSALVTGEALVNSNNYTFNTSSSSIYICALSGVGVWYNSTKLFSSGTPTPTPTPTITPTPLPTVVPGYVRNTLHVWDRSGNHINGANIQIKDVENNSWSNVSADADGIHYIDTLPYHTLNGYADFDIFENEFLPGSTLGIPTGYYGTSFYITLFPYESEAGEGQSSVYVEVKDAETGYYITYATVEITDTSTGYSQTQSTATHGNAVFLVTNDTTCYATATKSGYYSATEYFDSGDPSATVTIELTKAVVTASPTTTIPPGGVTPAVTVDPRSANEKDEDMMDLIRNNGEGLIQLAIAATIFGLLGLMVKSFKW